MSMTSDLGRRAVARATRCPTFPPNWPIEIWYGEELTQYG